MKIYRLSRLEKDCMPYDCIMEQIVVAKNETNARMLCDFGDEGKETWLNSSLTSCIECDLEKPMVLLSYGR